MNPKNWFLYALTTAFFWGIWGAFIEIPEKGGFPPTLGYSVWALTMIPVGVHALLRMKGRIDVNRRSIILGITTGILGCAGQLILFQALKTGPAYLIFPFISIAPVITILMSVLFLKERASRRAWAGIVIAVIAIFLLSYDSSDDSSMSGYLWIFFSLLVAAMWGIQAFILKFANATMKAESLVVYTMLTALFLIPVAIVMTDFSNTINWRFTGPGLTVIIQFLNAVGFLYLVYAFRYGRAIIVSPLVNALPPVITVIISLFIYRVIPHLITLTGMVMAIGGSFLLAMETEQAS